MLREFCLIPFTYYFHQQIPTPSRFFPWKTRHLGDRRPRWTFLVTLACRLYTLTPAATHTKVHHYLIQLHPTAIASYGHIRHSTLATCYIQPDYPNRQLSTTPPSGPFLRRHKALRTLSFHRSHVAPFQTACYNIYKASYLPLSILTIIISRIPSHFLYSRHPLHLFYHSKTHALQLFLLQPSTQMQTLYPDPVDRPSI